MLWWFIIFCTCIKFWLLG